MLLAHVGKAVLVHVLQPVSGQRAVVAYPHWDDFVLVAHFAKPVRYLAEVDGLARAYRQQSALAPYAVWRFSHLAVALKLLDFALRHKIVLQDVDVFVRFRFSHDQCRARQVYRG